MMETMNQMKLENLKLKKTILELQSQLLQRDWESLNQQEKTLMEEVKSNEPTPEAE